MRINSKELHGTPVFTERGISVGKISSFILDADTGKLIEILVSHRGIISGLLSDELIVPWNAIVEMSQERVVILDTSIPAEARTLAKQPITSPDVILKEHGS